jgi:Xaa-Pro aminopeptidase
VNYPGGWVYGALIGREHGPILMAPRMVADYHLSADVVRDVRVLPDQGDPLTFIRQLLAEFGAVRRAAIEDRAWATALIELRRLLPDATWSQASALMAPLRMRKDEDEVAVMRRASHLADQVLEAVLPRLKVGITELDVALEVNLQMERLGSNGPSFTTNVFTIGPFEQREMRETTSRRPLVEGVSLSFDFGCVLEGYCSDFGRTIHIGEPSAEFRRAYAIVIAAHDAAIGEMKAGAITAERANAVARAVVEDAGYGDYFRHRLGHGIGLDVHEAPFLTAGDATVLQEGMAFTVEPSIYWIGRLGARIEDVVIVRPGGGDVLNQAANALYVVA